MTMLYVIAVPIGNFKDITLRAISILKKVDFVICEEYRPADTLLRSLDIEKELLQLNEHNEATQATSLIEKIKGKKVALISDCGTPGFADPGTLLVQACHQANIPVSPIPGASSLTASLSVSGIDISQFYYAGFLTRKNEARVQELQELAKRKEALVIYDTPYRLQQVLQDIKKTKLIERNMTLALALTCKQEAVLHGNLAKIEARLQEMERKKSLFVLVVEGVNKHKK